MFPRAGTPCLEVGYGRLGALGTLISWGVRESDLHGIEMDPRRAAAAQTALPGADLSVGDARRMPWADGTFALVVTWTVFSSILSEAARQAVAAEIVRVLKPGGALLYYDFAWNNPRNPNVRGVSGREVRAHFRRPRRVDSLGHARAASGPGVRASQLAGRDRPGLHPVPEKPSRRRADQEAGRDGFDYRNVTIRQPTGVIGVRSVAAPTPRFRERALPWV